MATPSTSAGMPPGSQEGAAVRVRLDQARLEGRRRIARIQTPTLVVGLALVLTGIALSILLREVEGRSFFTCVIHLGIFVLLLTVVPNAPRVADFALAFLATLVMWGAVAQAYAISTPRYIMVEANACVGAPCWWLLVTAITHTILATIYLVDALYLLAVLLWWRPPTRARVSALWKGSGVMYACTGALLLARAVIGFLAGTMGGTMADLAHSTLVLEQLVLGIAALEPSFRIHAHAWLATRGETVGVAAGVAALLGRRSVENVLALSQKLFRCVPANAIVYEHFSTNTAERELYELTSPAKIGAVDAFVSHSWHDAPAPKWAELQRWRQRFVQQHRREPIMWFDKCCVDQSNIAQNLACLPIFLAGCSQLLLIVGPTYLSRLWCATELYVFLTMGGTLERVELLVPDGFELDPSAFDVRHAVCSCAADRERLLSTIEVGFEGLPGFNAMVRSVLTQLLGGDAPAQPLEGVGGMAPRRLPFVGIPLPRNRHDLRSQPSRARATEAAEEDDEQERPAARVERTRDGEGVARGQPWMQLGFLDTLLRPHRGGGAAVHPSPIVEHYQRSRARASSTPPEQPERRERLSESATAVAIAVGQAHAREGHDGHELRRAARALAVDDVQRATKARIGDSVDGGAGRGADESATSPTTADNNDVV